MTSREMPLHEFRQWLEDTTDLSTRSVGDTVSRLRRLRQFVDPLAVQSEAELEFKLRSHPASEQLKPTVRSQLKRAGRLYRQFRSGT